ncbi:MAG: phosphopyruvate hydratase [Clostridia bacterium]|nr:phosphopyruvate hydratase [Clostridia bacterium]MBQ4157670.1 phosphopyruvate hydratase [Clostridia bacterium]
MEIAGIRASEILDSRGYPTIRTRIWLKNGVMAEASVPSGASTGSHEAYEKRDGGKRYMGKGVLGAIDGINGVIARALIGEDVRNQSGIDTKMIALDGTKDKSSLGANAILSVSIAAARCASFLQGIPLYRYIRGLMPGKLPRVMMNVLNGGRHADNNLDIQEFMIVPKEGMPFSASIQMCAEIYRSLKDDIKSLGLSSAVGDEGGFAPNLETDEDALLLLTKASEKAGYAPGKDVFFALDMAAGEWADEEGYYLPKRRTKLTRAELMDYTEMLTKKYPIISVEDPLGEDDFDGFSVLTSKIGESVSVVGDDLFVTNPERISKGAEAGCANAVLIKPNQIGSVTETLLAAFTARRYGYRVIASHRSGDTADPFLADLAVGMNADFIKSGAPARSERTEKYNRLMDIADDIEAIQ